MSRKDVLTGLVESSAYEWTSSLALVFGGCCSNVWALDSILQNFPASGTFLTFAQFVFVTAQSLPSQIVLRKGRIRLVPRHVPVKRWLAQVVLFLAVSLINNYVFALHIPLTLHIIFRSGGLCVSMLMGHFMAKRRYTPRQALAGIFITVGIVMATLSTQHSNESKETSAQITGIALLSLALVLSAWLGLYQEETYRRHGNQWREGLFYTHFLSLPFFLPLAPTLWSNLKAFASQRRTLFALIMNVFTQSLCIRGVNRLTARVNSTTVNLILTLRKTVSLALSVWYRGSGASPGLVIGAGLVTLGTFMYSAPKRESNAERKRQ